MSIADQADIAARFRARYGRAAEVLARAPGRVNLIGDHTDYNDGFVLPVALAQATRCAAAPRDDGLFNVYSAQPDAAVAFRLPVDDDAAAGAALVVAPSIGAERYPGWSAYVAGVATLLTARGARLRGADLLIESDLPAGAGLASSAALCVALAKALVELAGEPIETLELARLCQQVEHRFAGVPCGLMDPLVSLAASEHDALWIDCRTAQTRTVPLPRPARLVWLIVDSGEKHALAAGEYARRRAECAAAVAYFRQIRPEIAALRDVEPETVRAHALQMDPVAAARALHVTSENRRVREAVEALRRGDARELGRLLHESHRSLRDDFETSCPTADRLVDALRDIRGMCGARITGGGLGGALVALVDLDADNAVEAAIRAAQAHIAPHALPAFRVTAATGATVEVVR